MLDEHKHRGEQLIYVFYALGALALVSIAVDRSGRKPRCRWRLRHWRWPERASASAATLPTWADTSEFRFEQAPELRTIQRAVIQTAGRDDN